MSKVIQPLYADVKDGAPCIWFCTRNGMEIIILSCGTFNVCLLNFIQIYICKKVYVYFEYISPLLISKLARKSGCKFSNNKTVYWRIIIINNTFCHFTPNFPNNTSTNTTTEILRKLYNLAKKYTYMLYFIQLLTHQPNKNRNRLNTVSS